VDTEARVVETQHDSEGEANFKRGSSGTQVAGVRHVEENPEAVENGEGGALEATKALLGEQYNPLKKT